VGGTPVIGAPDTQTYSLMQAINENRSRIKIYGWLNGGFNVSTSNKGDGANSPAAYYYRRLSNRSSHTEISSIHILRLLA
jgi:hypothetical protein